MSDIFRKLYQKLKFIPDQNRLSYVHVISPELLGLKFGCKFLCPMTLAPHTRNEFENYIQECIPVGYQPPACRPYVLHNEKVRTCPESLFGGADAGAMYRVPRLGPCVYRGGQDQGLSEEGASIVKANPSWVMGTGDLPPPPNRGQTHTTKTLPFRNFVGGR